MKYLRWLLFPFSLLYGLVVIFRNWCYDAGAFKSYKFNKPVISVGNLDVGGAGKSPMTEYLIRLLKGDCKLATLSRGYGRETKGYLVAEDKNQESRAKSQEPRVKNQESRAKSQESRAKSQEPRVKSQEPRVKSQESRAKSQEISDSYSPLTTDHSSLATDNSSLTTDHSPLATIVGDEPAQFKHKFPDITVAVCGDRVAGLKQLLPTHDLILLDDAYQHRAVEPGLSILLFDYNRVNEPHLLLPAGNMREPFSGRWRAQILVITKCPKQLNMDEQEALAARVKPQSYQSLFFSSIAYKPLQRFNGSAADVAIDKDTTIFLLTGIASAQPLLNYLNGFTPHIIHHKYPDHHSFTGKNIAKLAGGFGACTSQKKLIITTEKDAQRLEGSWFNTGLPGTETLPVFILPISVEFLNGTGPQFDKIVIDYVREHTTHHGLH